MPDYIYLLDNRLSTDQQNALRQMRTAARDAGMLVFLTGDAIRDLTSGHAVRDLEVTVHGNALKLKKPIEKLGAKTWGESEIARSLYLCFPGTVRLDVISAQRVEYPRPGKPVYHTASIQEELRRRDFTVNAMAISLNEGSFGLLMDPLNGAADIEARTLRLVSNYGFLEEPALLIRATRYLARLGWEFDPKTAARYENAKNEGAIEALSAEARSQELEQIGHEEDGLKVLRALEAEGWMKVLFPAWTSAKADEEKLKALHELAVELILQGVHPDMSAAQMQLLTAKLAGKELTALKKLMLRPGFVAEWSSLDSLAAGFAKVLMSKAHATPSSAYKLFTSYDPEAILWLGFTSRDAAVRERFNQFLKVWPEAKQRIPHAQMQEMRITPELAKYGEIVHAIFLELIDGKLTTPEEMQTFLEPHSPPAPPPKEIIKRTRAKRGAEAKIKEPSYEDDDDAGDGLDVDEDLDDIGGEEEEIDLSLGLPKADIDVDLDEDGGDEELEGEEPGAGKGKHGSKKIAGGKKAAAEAAAVKPGAKKTAVEQAKKTATAVAASAKKAEKPAAKAGKEEKPAVKARPAAEKPHAAAKAKTAPHPAKTAAVKKPLPVPAKAGKAAAKAPVKAPAKAPAKTPAKAPVKAPHKAAAAKGKTAAAAHAKTKHVPAKAKGAKPAKKR
jgi:tRNA nucleotidyltransferase/poly(A) polymerase